MTDTTRSLNVLLTKLESAYEWMCLEDMGKYFMIAWEEYIKAMGEPHTRGAERNECDCLRRPDSEDMPIGLKPISPTNTSEIPVVDDLEKEYQKLRYQLIRYGDYHPDTKADIAWLISKNPASARCHVDTMAMLVERYRALRKPEPVSVEELVPVIQHESNNHTEPFNTTATYTRWVKAILDAAGVKYVED